jgi:hypothetical protein
VAPGFAVRRGMECTACGRALWRIHSGCGPLGTHGPAASGPGSCSPRAMRFSRHSHPHEGCCGPIRSGNGIPHPLLELHDGPLIELGLQGIVGQVIQQPQRSEDRADRDRLARRLSGSRNLHGDFNGSADTGYGFSMEANQILGFRPRLPRRSRNGGPRGARHRQRLAVSGGNPYPAHY